MRITSAVIEAGTIREKVQRWQVLIIANRKTARQFSASCSRIRQK